MDYKILFLDLDGTLLDDNKEISITNMQAIKSTLEKGIKVVFCTGRVPSSAQFFSSMFGDQLSLVASNGAFIHINGGVNADFSYPICLEDCRKAFQIMKKNNMNSYFHSHSTIYIGQNSNTIRDKIEWYKRAKKGFSTGQRTPLSVVKDWDLFFSNTEIKVLNCVATHSDLDVIASTKTELSSIFDITSTRVNNIELMKKGISKGNGVRMIANYYGIKREEIVCVGDNENDVSMFQYSGLRIAMDNATDNLKQCADFITCSNNKHGVAEAINSFIL